MNEALRIAFLIERDGSTDAEEWVLRTLRIYRSSVLNRSHFAGSGDYRRGFIESYLSFKSWLSRRGKLRNTEIEVAPMPPNITDHQASQEKVMSTTPAKSGNRDPAVSKTRLESELKHMEEALDEALLESFPASDPIALSFTSVAPVQSKLR